MRDPRQNNTQAPAAIQPWLEISGNYDTYLDSPVDVQAAIHRSIMLSGGLSVAKSFRRTSLVLGYFGSGSDYLGRSAGKQEGWSRSTNILNFAISSQVARRLTLDFSESGGAGNGGFGAAAGGLGSNVLGAVGMSSGFLFGGGAGLGGGIGPNPLQNGLVDADYYDRMAYFSSTSANAGILLSSRTMLNFGGTATFVRRPGSSYGDSNIAGTNAMVSTQFSHRLTAFVGYAFNRMDFIHSIRTTYIQSGFTGIQYKLAPHDSLSLALSASFLDARFSSYVALPQDVAAQLGVTYITTVRGSKRTFMGGKLGYNHAFQRGGFDLACESSLTPGNDLVLLTRREGCVVALSRTLSERVSVTGLAGLMRLDGLSRTGGRYDVATGGLVFSYRIARGFSFTAGASYRANQVSPSKLTTTGVNANAGLYWSPREGIHLF